MCICVYFFFFKQKTAYEMRISDWSLDVCSSDLEVLGRFAIIRDAHQKMTVILDSKGSQDKEYKKLQGLILEELTAFRFSAKQVEAQIGGASCWERVCQYV